MLDTTTKRRIDTARDILVGKIPDPKSQVEQITIALIYKFMDDMDAESEELGGQRKFFSGEFARYGWAKLMRSGLGGHESLSLYAEAIARMPENPGIPLLFRNIFKNAFLPYRDPETLRAFLKIIDEFSYDHSERLGDAFEYLLSVLGSQGDAGQFRTPRHIIDFIVAVVDPKKNEVVLDPACGTAGFLISSYKHIKSNNTDDKGNLTLTPDERGSLVENFKGYDISPDMVRLSLVNLYLHGFSDPHIYEYDTLTSQDRWNEYADVILANPPFMSPKGGIRPHNRFSVQSKRSEVLFVDYIAEHLTPEGRAGVIVPEGIIFQSQNAYKQLRKKLIDESLVAVISLPAGVFQPYSGVKTSILIMDKTLAKKADTIAFFKVENDGYGLGAQRRAIDKNDLPQVLDEVKGYLDYIRAGDGSEEYLTQKGLVVKREKIAENGEYNLSGERYREVIKGASNYPKVALGDIAIFTIESGGTPKSSIEEYWNGEIPWATLVDLPNSNMITEINSTKRTISNLGLQKSSAKLLPANSVIVSTRATIGRIAINRVPLATNQGFKNIVIKDQSRAKVEYIAYILTKLVPVMQNLATGGIFKELSKTKFGELEIPLPPLEIQKEIVAEIESYQKVIDGARTVVENYRPHIPIEPTWPLIKINEIADIVRGSSPRPKNDSKFYGGPVPRLMVADITRDGMYTKPAIDTLTEEGAKYSRPMKKGDVVITVSGNPGLPTILAVDACIHDGFVGLRNLDNNQIMPEYLYFNLLSQHKIHGSLSVGAVFKNLTTSQIAEFQIPLPSFDIQEAIVREIKTEQELVNNNRKLIVRFEKKVKNTINRCWDE
jgi:type I restriction enzyme M protein